MRAVVTVVLVYLAVLLYNCVYDVLFQNAILT